MCVGVTRTLRSLLNGRAQKPPACATNVNSCTQNKCWNLHACMCSQKVQCAQLLMQLPNMCML